MSESGSLVHRWKPVRSGLINLFKYEDQIFHFENGHLLLRGDNGSGKSRVLALQLPFLLDGDMSPFRVEPDRDPAKRMEWNLLMDKHERRRGYTWIEFERVDEKTGETLYLSLGCGLEARKGGGRPDRWFFISQQRVGFDFPLVREKRVLSSKELAANFEQAGKGRIIKKTGEYRTAVDEALFKLGARYGPLIDLLIQLRQPQLMRDMKDEELSARLSEALPPVGEGLIAEVAESFQGLDSDRKRTDDHREILESVEVFRDGYRQYLAVAIRRLCEVVRIKQSQFKGATRGLRDIDAKISATSDQLEEAGELAEVAKTKLAKLEAEIDTLRDSPEMRSKRDLDLIRKRAESAEGEAENAREDFEKASEAVKQASRDREMRAEICEQRREEVERDYLAFALVFEVIFPKSVMFFDWIRGDLAEERTAIEASIVEKERSVKHLRERNSQVAAGSEKVRAEKAAVEHCQSQVDTSTENLAETETALKGAIDQFSKAVTHWEQGLKILRPPVFLPGMEWGELLGDWLDERLGVFDFETKLKKCHSEIREEITRSLAILTTEINEVEQQEEEIRTQLHELRTGRQSEPVLPICRAARPKNREGAPFWKWFEFHESIPDTEKAGWESALQSAGLLDAWIFPNGESALDTVENDDFLYQRNDEELKQASSLAAILKPVVDEASGVDGILRQIGNHRDAALCWVDKTGHWANGPHFGHWEKSAAEFLGHQAREDARLRRIAELETGLKDFEREIEQLKKRQDEQKQRDVDLSDEVAAAPLFRSSLEFAIRVDSDRDTLLVAKSELVKAVARVSEVERKLEALVEKRDADAVDMGLSAWAQPQALDEFSQKLSDFKNRASGFWPQWQRFREHKVELDLATTRETTARETEAAKRIRHEEKRDEADRTRTEVDTLLASVGATVEELMNRLALAEGAAKTANDEYGKADKSIRNHEIENAKLGEAQNAAREKRVASETDRNRAVGRMEVFVKERLFEELDVDYQPDRAEFSATAAVDLARHMEEKLKEHPCDDERWGLLQSGISRSFGEFSDQLISHGHMPQMRVIDETSVTVVDCEFQGERRTVLELRDVIAGELTNRERIFEESEREIIENHLIGEAAMELQKRIRYGEDWVVTVNSELKRVTTSSGIQLKFSWEVADSDDERLRAVRTLFLKTSATWSDVERDEIGQFLQNRIQSEREADDSVSWRDHLSRALDYRTWHRFGIYRKIGSEANWKKLTKRTFGTGSGGEKAMTLTVPQFAAAAAHYHSADRYAPRLILLDEVFVGIDAPTRARLMGLLETFDLDYMMTSEREWGAFPSVSALAIYQLATRPNYNSIAVTRWVWNGSEKRQEKSARDDSSRGIIPVTKEGDNEE
ncbi:MAG: TIGR02680 family protein [Verrucomicrobiales bacterium]|nr:TIGR02680 family protein [Verrucomicrobiales bacterium]